jgi:hypothetical protein
VEIWGVGGVRGGAYRVGLHHHHVTTCVRSYFNCSRGLHFPIKVLGPSRGGEGRGGGGWGSPANPELPHQPRGHHFFIKVLGPSRGGEGRGGLSSQSRITAPATWTPFLYSSR